MAYRQYLQTLILLLLGLPFFFGCAKLPKKDMVFNFEPKLSMQEYCYINNKIISYVIESNDILFDLQTFTYLEFDKSNSYIMYDKMNDSTLSQHLNYLTDTMANPSITLINNKIDVLKVCNSSQMSAHYIDQKNKTVVNTLNANSLYKCHFTISDIIQIGEDFYIFCDYKEYFKEVDEIEHSTFAFQFNKCINNDFIKFDYFFQWLDEMSGHQHFKLLTTKNDSIILNDVPDNDRFYQEAGFIKRKMKSFDCVTK